MKTARKLFVVGAWALCGVLGATQVHAQVYPSKPIRIIAPSGVGGPVDVICRLMSQGLSEQLGQPLVVENRVGASGLIGADLVAKAAADGYTLLFGFSGPLAIVPSMNPKTPYDPLRDFALVSKVATTPYVLLVHPSVPATSVKQLVALAKSRPGKMNFGSGGVSSGLHMAGELLNYAAGLKIVHVPFQGAGPTITSLMAGEIDMMFNGLPPSLPHIASGRVRVLAVGSPNRTALLPGVPTILENGFDFNTEGWYGVAAPRGTPQPIIDTLHKALVQAMGTAEMKSRMTKLGIDGGATTPAEFAKLVRDENEMWRKVIKAAGIKVQ